MQLEQAADAADDRDDHEHRRRHARQRGEAEHRHRRDDPRLGLAGDLLGDLPANVRFDTVLAAGHAGDDHAAGDRNQQRRDLRDQAVADGQHGVDLQGVAGGHVVLHHADGDAADHVDGDDDQAGDGVAVDELHGPVHGAEQLTFLAQFGAPFARFVDADQVGAQVAVDGHLLARHRVKGEARADFRHPLRALGDHQKVDHGEDQKDHHAHRQVAADHELAERFDDVPGVLIEQDQARGGNRQRQPKHRRQQQHRRKRRERQRPRQVHRQHDQQAGDADVDGDQHVHQTGRQRGDHHENDGDDHERTDDFRAAHGGERDAIEQVNDTFHQARPPWSWFCSCRVSSAMRMSRLPKAFWRLFMSRQSRIGSCCSMGRSPLRNAS